MAKIEPWHTASTAFTTGESTIGGEDMQGGGERVYHDNDISDASNSPKRSMRKKLSGIIRGR